MKLHRMPLLIKRMIIEELNIDERLFLSFTSKRTCSLLGLFRNDFKSISIDIEINNLEISVCVRKPSYRLSEQISVFKICSYFDNKWNFNMPNEQRQSKVQPEQYPSTIYCDLNDKRVGRYTTSNLVIVFRKLLRHLNKFLKIEKCCQCEFNNVIPVGLIPQLDCTYSYEKIHIRKANPADVSPEDLTLLLEHIKTKQLCLNVAVSSVSDYKYQKNPEKKSSIDVLKIVSYSWVDFSDLPAARVISIKEELQLDQMNVMLRSWVAGRNREMEIGYFETEKTSDQNWEAIYSGIEKHATQLTGAEFKSIFDSNQNLPSTELLRSIVAADIIREDDGMRATVIEAMLWPHRWARRRDPKQTMFVIVWSERNLKKARGE
ncbi:unnamed protein product [Caenorhabditis nigoni]